MEDLARKAIVLVIVVVLIAGVMTFYVSRTPLPSSGASTQAQSPGSSGSKTNNTVNEIIIYTYNGFMAWGSNPNETYKKIFNEFENEYHVKVKVVRFDSARQALLAAINEYRKNERTANIIIGVDNLLAYEAKEAGIVQCYYSPLANASVPQALAISLDPDKCITPFDYGLLAIVYDPARLPQDIQSKLVHPTLWDLASPEIAKRLVLEDPTKSSTGLGFLFWEIGLSTKLYNKPWTDWWNQAKQYILVEPSWGKAYDIFSSNSSNRPIIISYGTDPAYSAYYSKNGEPSINASLIYVGNESTGWLQVEGVVLVKNQPGTNVAKEFIDWLLSKQVQSLIPLNQWMLPARNDVELPACYKYALTLDNVNVVVNNLFTPGEIENGYQNWLFQWTQLMGSK